MAPTRKSPKSVLVVGAGAAGMSCASRLALHPEKFQVTLIDEQDFCGGQAFSIPVDKEKYGADWLNQGVQGGSPIYHHTCWLFKECGFEAPPCSLQVSFGNGDHFWTNMFPTDLIDRHHSEIRKFNRVLKLVRYLEIFFLVVPIKTTLSLFRFSEDFKNYMILPTIALFLGTGNATPEVPTVIMERIFTDKHIGMWYPPDKDTLAGNEPAMNVFPDLGKFYSTMADKLTEQGVQIRLKTKFQTVISRNTSGVEVELRDLGRDTSSREHFDELVLCMLPDHALSVLGKQASWKERNILGSAKFADDITVTHSDAAYIRKHYTNTYAEAQSRTSLPTKIGDVSFTDRHENAKGGHFQPMYYIKQCRGDPKKLEMCFDCTNYQSQFKHVKARDAKLIASGNDRDALDGHIFQTIFLNKNDRALWDIDEIDESKIIQKNWWHQLQHSWTHYVKVVPWFSFLHSKSTRTTYAGSWSLVNAHEVAVISGMAAAYKLGAGYPKELDQDSFARKSFRGYLMLAHRSWYSRSRAE